MGHLEFQKWFLFVISYDKKFSTIVELFTSQTSVAKKQRDPYRAHATQQQTKMSQARWISIVHGMGAKLLPKLNIFIITIRSRYC